MVNYTGRGLVVKRPGVLSKVQMLNLVLSQDTQPPLTPRQGLDYRGRVPDASP